MNAFNFKPDWYHFSGSFKKLVLFVKTFGFLLLFSLQVFSQGELKVKIDRTDVNQKDKLVITEVTLNDQDIKSELKPENFKIESDTNSIDFVSGEFPNFTVSGKAGTANLMFIYTKEGNEIKFELAIEVKQSFDLESVRLVETGSDEEKKLSDGLTMLSTEKKEIKILIKDKNGDVYKNASVKLESNNSNVIKFSDDEILLNDETTNLLAQAVKGELSATVTLKSGSVLLGNFTVKVAEKITSIQLNNSGTLIADNQTVEIEENKRATLSFKLNDRLNVVNEQNKIPGGNLLAKSDDESLVKAEIKGNTLVLQAMPVAPGDIDASDLVTKVTISADQLGTEVQLREFNVEVKLSGFYITVDKNPLALVRNDSQIITAYVKRSDNDALDRGATFKWTLKNSDDEKWVTLAPQGDRVNVIWKNNTADVDKNRPDSVEILVSATTSTGKRISTNVQVNLVAPVDFADLEVKLTPMDSRTVRDLFGTVTDEEYFIVKVRMFNNLKDTKTNEYLGASMLVYNGSFEVGVLLQKQYDKGSKVDLRQKPTTDLSYHNPNLWYDTTLKDFNEIQEVPPSYDKDISKNQPKQPLTCSTTLSYRPLSYEMSLNTVDKRDSRRVRTRIFTILDMVAKLGAFSAAINFPGNGRDFEPVLDRFSNLLIPGFEKIFPSLKEVHRQNIVSMMMQPIEEVPFGTEKQKVLMIPKKSITGILKDHKVRISQICPFNFSVQVAVIRRGDKGVVQSKP